jgi:hypothetical protein
MRFYKPKRRTRLMLAGCLLLVAMATPLLVDLARPHAFLRTTHHDTVSVYASGLSALDTAAVVALPLAMIFALWLIRGEQREVNVRILNQRARNRQNLINALRTLAVVIGVGSLIAGCLGGLYAGLTALRPGLAFAPGLHFTLGAALACLIGGGAAYAAGKAGRPV